MNKLENAIVIFGLENGQYCLSDVKQVYRKLASVNHPDKGGSTETMQLINTAFSELCKYFELNATLDINQETETNHSFDFSFMDTLKTLHGVIIEVCGYWVWLSGNTYPHKETISNLGFKFSGAKKSWYWSPTIDTSKYKRGSKSMKNIRQEFGSKIIKTEAQAAIN
ncbi:MAG: J domain-containing protein [Burkholderiales bacterium]|nr:J domain-containing protein [Burkholderiales bacterium]